MQQIGKDYCNQIQHAAGAAHAPMTGHYSLWTAFTVMDLSYFGMELFKNLQGMRI